MEVNDLYYNHHMSKVPISRKKRVSRDFVRKWTKSKELDFSKDTRGWPSNKRRKWSKQDEKRIKEIYEGIKRDPKEFYIRAPVIEQEWRKRYPEVRPPALRTIGATLKELGLSKGRRRNRHKGAARYLCYPEHTIYNLLGGRVLEADFIGKKCVSGRTAPINFIGFSFKKEPRLRYFKRIESKTASSFIKEVEEFFRKFEKLRYIKIDNSLAFIGSGSGKRNISQVMMYLLKEGVIPIFSVPREPFSQASIEGNNSVFSRKFWNRVEFRSIQEIDEKLEWFNESSRKYTGY